MFRCSCFTLNFHFLISIIIMQLAYFVDSRKVINFSPMEMSRSEVINYFRFVLRVRFSTFDRLNEEVYSGETFPEDLYHSIDNLMSREKFVKYLWNTKNITDKIDSRGLSLLSNYPGSLNSKCSPSTVFNHSLHQIVTAGEVDKLKIYEDLETWQIANAITPFNLICNRFRGLTCQYKTAKNVEADQGESFDISSYPTCQCEGDGANVGFFRNAAQSNGKYYSSTANSYPDGCYIRPWRPCHHVSMDYAFRNDYYDQHTSRHNQKSLLTQMTFPVGRAHRCKQGTYCLDLIPGMKKPVCWCTQDSKDKTCLDLHSPGKSKVISIGTELASIRRNFVKLFISVNDLRTECDTHFSGKIEKIANSSGIDPTQSGVLELMKELLEYKDRNLRICDFRRSYYCDVNTRRCVGRWSCDPGKIHLDNGLCAVDNGFRCQTNEDCIEGSECKLIEGTKESFCMCKNGYGSKCKIENPSFFAKRFLPVVSGFKEDEYVNLQEKINSVLVFWEGSMNRKEGEGCDFASDLNAIEIVNYFGNLVKYDKEKGDKLLTIANSMAQNGPRLCKYTKFLRCDARKHQCVTLAGSHIISHSATNPKIKYDALSVQVQPGELCGKRELPKIFHETLELLCTSGYECKVEGGKGGEERCMPDCSVDLGLRDECPDGVVSNSDDLNDEVREKKDVETSSQIEYSSREDKNDTDQVLRQYSAKPREKEPMFHSTYVNMPSSLGTHESSSGLGDTDLPVGDLFEPVGGDQDESHEEEKTEATTAKPDTKSVNALYGDYCLYSYNDSTTANFSAQPSLACHSESYLYCHKRSCDCYPSLVYSERKRKCTIPIGNRCEEKFFPLPSPMKFSDLECNFGKCLKGNSGFICRPESSSALNIVVPFIKND